MEYRYDPAICTLTGAELIERTNSILTFTLTEDNATIGFPPLPDEIECNQDTIFTAFIHTDSTICRSCTLQLTDVQGSIFCDTVQLFPNTCANLIFRLRYTDGELHYPPLEAGTLKSSVWGQYIQSSQVRRPTLIFNGNGVSFTLANPRFTDNEPVKVDAGKPVCDQFGQWTAKEWIGKIHSTSELMTSLCSAADKAESGDFCAFRDGWDRWGGDRSMPLAEPTGFFRIKKDKKGKWWFVDPDGYAFYSMGVFGVYAGEPGWVYGNEDRFTDLPAVEGEYADAWSYAEDYELFRRKFHGLFPSETRMYSFGTANLMRAFGSKWYEKWTTITNYRLHNWSVNTLSMFSDPDFIEKSSLPFVVMIPHFPTTSRLIFREFPDIFSDEYKKAAEIYAAQLLPYRGNPNLIGYFLNNEPTWAWSSPWTLAEKLLEKDNCYVSRTVFVDHLLGKYGSAEAIGCAWDISGFTVNRLNTPLSFSLNDTARADLSEFTAIMVREYVRIPSDETRKYDPDHLNLGMRFAGNNAVTIGTAEYFDVYSFNCYGLDPYGRIDDVAKELDMPILIGEFHFGSYERGLPAASLVVCESEQARDDAYAYYVRRAASHPASVGIHYFAFNDQPLWGRYDGENYPFGMVDICMTPYAEFIQAICETNSGLYDFRRNMPASEESK